MFELNLIKDKAKARQRRRVIFLSVVSILFLAGLLGIFVGSLYWRETIVLKRVNNEVADTEGKLNALRADLDTREPKARKRRNALIKAWKEDYLVRTDRPSFTPIVEDLAKYHPSTAKFWYNSITISTNVDAAGRGTQVEDPNAAAKALMGTRGLEANGYIQIEASEIITQSELRQMSRQMSGMMKLVGPPTFALDLAREDPSAAAALDSEGRYVPFTMRAEQTLFRPNSN
jgi:hypothetical protein